MKNKNIVLALVLAIFAMASTAAFAQLGYGGTVNSTATNPCTFATAPTALQNGVTGLYSTGTYAITAGQTNCYLIIPTYDAVSGTQIGNTITWQWNTVPGTGTTVGNNYSVTANPGFTISTAVNGVLKNGAVNWWQPAATPGNGVGGGGYGIPVNGIGGPNYGTGYNGVAVGSYIGNVFVPYGNSGSIVNGVFVPGTVTISGGNTIFVPNGTGNPLKLTNGIGGVIWGKSSSGSSGLDTLGGDHNGSCAYCHTPHNQGRMDATSQSLINNGVATTGNIYQVTLNNGLVVTSGTYTIGSGPGQVANVTSQVVFTSHPYNNAGGGAFSPYAPTSTPAFVWRSSGYGTQLGGSANPYLWGKALTAVNYRTWDDVTTAGSGGGGSFNPATVVTGREPIVHSLLCLSCHDGSMSSSHMKAAGTTAVVNGVSYTTTTGLAGGQQSLPGYRGTSTSQTIGGITVSSVSGTVASAGATVAWGTGSLAANHPIHAIYPSTGLDPVTGQPAYWKLSAVGLAGGTATYADTDTNQIGDSGFFGHPGRLYSDGANAWVECTSCHNPHRLTSPAWVNTTGKYTVGAFGTTNYYIRGPYSTTDGTIEAGFCRSCHYEKSPEFVAYGGASK